MADQPLDARGLPEGYPSHHEHEITPRETRDRLARADGLVLLDIREPDELAIARIPGAIAVPMGTAIEHHDDLADDLPNGRDTQLAVICHHGSRSLRATLALRTLGFTDVRSVAGGIDLWSRDIDAAIPRY